MSHHLHRIYAQNAATVWELEARLLRSRGCFRPPAAVQWIATRGCDLRCGHCYSDAGHRQAGELTTAEALALVDALAAMGCPDLVIAGGEPLLRRDLPEIVEYAVGRGLRWSLHTHGGLVLRHADLFARHPPALAAVSLDGPEPMHDAFRGRVGSFRAALEAVAFLHENAAGRPDARVVIGTTVTSQNADHLADLALEVMRSPADSWGLHLFAPEGRGADNADLAPRPAQLRRVARLARRMRRRMDVDLDNEWGSAGPLDPFFRDQPYLCGAGRFTCVVATNGDIMPCTTTDPAEAEGNVRTHDLREVWRTGFARFRGEGDSRPGGCGDGADCWLQTRNGRSCRADAFGPLPQRSPLPPLPPSRQHKKERTEAENVRALALAAVVAVLALPGIGGAADPGPGGFPADFDLMAWARHQPTADAWDDASGWTSFKQQQLRRQPALTGGGFPALAAALQDPGRQEAAVLLAALDEAERIGAWDPWLVQQLWVRSGPGPTAALADLYARLERHARVVDSLILAVSETGPVSYLPWRKKSAPPQGYQPARIPENFLEAAREHYARLDAGTWRQEAAVPCTLQAGSAGLFRQGSRQYLSAGETLTLARFDVLVLNGTLSIGGHTIEGQDVQLDAWRLPGLLSASSHAALAVQVDAAMRGDAAAIDALGDILPLAHDTMRLELAETPDAPGAPAVRQLLVLFDE